MMIAPETYAEDFKDANLEELIAERDRLYADIRGFEAACIDFKDHQLKNMADENGFVINPGPDVIYQCYLGYLSEICKLVQQRFNKEFEQMDFDDA